MGIRSWLPLFRRFRQRLRSKGNISQSLVEFPDCQHGVCSKSHGILFGMIDAHLSRVGAGPLGIRNLKVCAQVIKGRLQRRDLVSKALARQIGSCNRPAGVVVQEYECNVVSVLGRPSRICSSHLGKQEPCQTRNIYFGVVLNTSDSRGEAVHFEVSGYNARTAKVCRTEALAFIE